MEVSHGWKHLGALALIAAIGAAAPGTAGAQCLSVDTGDVYLVAEGGGACKARFRRRDDCRRDLRVEEDNVELHYYDLCVDGVFFGSFQAVKVAGGTHGEVEFDDVPDKPGERQYAAGWPEALGAQIEVRDSAKVAVKNRKTATTTAPPCTGALRFSYTSFPSEP